MLNMHTFVIQPVDISSLEKLLLDAGGNLQPVPFDAIKKFPQNDISYFCHQYGIYQIVTTELVEFVREQIEDFSAIEIGAGNGCLGRALGIPLTDSKIQEAKDVKNFYGQIKQPPVRYGADVRKLDALTAVKMLKATAAVGAWVTHKYKSHLPDGFFGGVDEAVLSKRLKRYVFVGNAITHKNKEMLRFCQPKEYRFDWLVSRSPNRAQNIIWTFDFTN